MSGDATPKEEKSTVNTPRISTPVRSETEPLGHCVRGAYMWAAATDMAAATGDAQLLGTMETLWDNVVSRKMYVTGGMGGGLYNEGFAPDYDLSHEYAYNETCAACAMMFWSHRLADVRGDSKYTDVLERVLYNGFASGRSLDGTRLYYNNFVKRTKVRGRAGNRLLRRQHRADGALDIRLSIRHENDDGIWTHLYMAGKATIPYGESNVTIDQQTSYPWDGNVKLTFTSERPGLDDIASPHPRMGRRRHRQHQRCNPSPWTILRRATCPFTVRGKLETCWS